jgi:gluconolactonase
MSRETFTAQALAASSFFTPEGKHLATLLIPERVGNLAWAALIAKRSTSAASTSVYRVRLSIPGEPVTQSKSQSK